MEKINQPTGSPLNPSQPFLPEHSVKNPRGFFNVVLGALILLIVASGAYYLGTGERSSSCIDRDIEQSLSPTSPPVTYSTSQSNPNINHPPANISSLKGRLIFRYNNYILISDPNGSNPMKLIESSNKLGFAGWSDNGNVFYYSELVGTTGNVYKKDLITGATTQLFTFDSKGKNIETFAKNVAISRDGKYAIYSHSGGDLSLYDLENKTTRLIFAQKECLSYNIKQNNNFSFVKPAYAEIGECYGFYYPYWSPNNQRVVVRKILNEGATLVIVNPFSNPITEKDLKSGGNPPDWTSNGEQIVLPGGGYGSGSLYLVNSLDNPVIKDLLANTEYNESIVHSGVISRDNKIAFSYSIEEGGKNESGIALYNLANNSVNHLLTTTDGIYYVQLWLSDNKNLLYTTDNGELWSLDITTLAKQKFPVMAQEVIGIVE